MTEAAPAKSWQALILAAGRGPDDPMAKAYGVANKSVIPVAGIPMLKRVAAAVEAAGCVAAFHVVIEDPAIATGVLGPAAPILPAAASAPASVLRAMSEAQLPYPVLVTTADHALLTPRMIRHFCAAAEATGADFCAGLATAETIQQAYPQTRRTYFALGSDRVSGCNLFALFNPRALRILERWQYLEQARKKPWRLVAAFGLLPLASFALGRLTLDKAFASASRRLGVVARPVIMPFAEAAIDVDKPSDKDLAEAILAARSA